MREIGLSVRCQTEPTTHYRKPKRLRFLPLFSSILIHFTSNLNFLATPCSQFFPVGQGHQLVENLLQSLEPTFLIRC